MIYTNEQIYSPMDLSDEEFDAILNKSLNPRASTMLYAKMGAMGLSANHALLDIGCRDLRHGLRLVEEYGCRVVGVDPLPYHIGLATEKIEASGFTQQASAEEGTIESIPTEDSSFDFIFCRDMLSHVEALEAGFAECFRVLKPGGQMLIYATLSTEQLLPAEAEQLFPPLGVPANAMEPINIESAFAAAGFQLVEKDQVGSEWREYWEEDGTNTTSRQLLWIARLLRNKDAYIEQIGEANYEIELANCHWGVYQMLGKLCPTVYVLRKQ